MTEAARISIALATYNGARYLRAQLDSILQQTRLPDEIIARDDASTDDEATWRILETYEAKLNRAGIHTDFERGFDNLGYQRNFERILKKVSGELVFLCDQDDIWHPEKIATMAGAFANDPRLGLLFTDARLVSADGQDVGYSLFEAVQITPQELASIHKGHAGCILLERTLVTGATAAFRRQVLDTALPFPAGWIHDEWLAFSIALGEQYRVDVLPEKLIDYRQHDENAIGMKRPEPQNFWAANGLRRHTQRSLAVRLQRLLKDSRRIATIEPHWLEELEQRRIHAHHRGHLSRNPFKRAGQIARELTTGRYFKYARGWRSVLSDLALLQ